MVSVIMQELDARRLLCPMPVIRTQNAVQSMTSGERLRVVCTDPGALNDIPTWCRINGHKVVSMETQEQEIIIIVEVA